MCLHLGCHRKNFFCFGSNRNKPKLDLFRFCLGLFRETKKFFRFVAVLWNRFEINQHKKSAFETNWKWRNTLLSNGHGRGHGHTNGHRHDFLFWFEPKLDLFRFFREAEKKFRFVSVFRNCCKMNWNKKLAFRNKSKLKIIPLLCNGHGRGHGHWYRHRNGHFSFVSVCFEWSSGVLAISKHQNKMFTNVLFQIVPKLVTVPVSFISHRN
jgi:hypothetical protein